MASAGQFIISFGAVVFAGLTLIGGAAAVARADPIVLQGSTTVVSRLIEPHQAAIAAAAGNTLSVVPNKTATGLIALLEGRAAIAMISAPLQVELEALRGQRPDLPVADLQAFEVSRTRVAFVVHPDNPVRQLDRETLRRVLAGDIANWQALGGPPIPIRPVMRRDGGVVQTVSATLLDGKQVDTAAMIPVNSARLVLKVVAQEAGAIGIAQHLLAAASGLPELVTDEPVEQIMSLVTRGSPNVQVARVIDAVRRIGTSAGQ